MPIVNPATAKRPGVLIFLFPETPWQSIRSPWRCPAAMAGRRKGERNRTGFKNR